MSKSKDGEEAARRLCWILATLNYDGQRTLVSPASFSKPNFNLVCDILAWFARIVNSRSLQHHEAIPEKPKRRGKDETGGTSFLIGVGKVFAKRLSVQLDLVALYRADMESCCGELLRLAEPIYQAATVAAATRSKGRQMAAIKSGGGGDGAEEQIKQILSHINQEDGVKSLSLAISRLAHDLAGLLEEELEFNKERLRVMDRRLEVPEIEQVMSDAQGELKLKTQELARSNGELSGDLGRLDERLRAKELEIQETRERLNDLLLKAPAYVDKWATLYKAYEEAYAAYVEKYRNLMYLKSCVYADDDEAAAPAEVSPASTDELGLTRELAEPPKLLESLLEGASNPMSASLTTGGDATATGAAAGTATGWASTVAGAATTTGRRMEEAGEAAGGLRTKLGLAADGGLGLEIEGLLNEFGADGDEEADGASMGKLDDDGDEDENEDDEEDEEGLEGSF